MHAFRSSLVRKTGRDLWAGRWASVGIAVLVAVVSILVAGGSRASAMFEHTREAWYRDLRLPDVDVRCSPARPETLDGIERIEGIASHEARLVARGTLIDATGARLPALVQVLRDAPARFNRLHVLRGRIPRPGERAALVDRSLTASHGVGPGASIELRVGEHTVSVPVVGSVLSPEHVMLPVHPEYALPLRGTIALVAVTQVAVADIPRVERFNSLQIALEPGADPHAVANRIADALPIAVSDVVERTAQPGRQFTDMVHKTFDIYWPAVAGVMLLVALVLLTLTLERLVARQRSQFGVLRAIGHRSRHLVAATLPLAVIPALAGFALGVGLHGFLARGLFRLYAESVGLPPLRDPGPPSLWPLGVAVVSISALIATLTCLRATAPSPAMLLRPRAWAPPSKASWPVRLATRLREALRLPVVVVMGWTNVIRRRVASIASVVGLGAAFALIIAFLLVHVTHRRVVEDSLQRLGLDATVQFDEPVGAEVWTRVGQEAGGHVEPLVTRRALLGGENDPVYRRIVCVAPGKFTAQQELIEGRMFASANANEVVVDRWVADRQGLAVGDEVWLYAYANSPDAIAARVVGLLQGVHLGLVLLPLETGRALFGLPALATAAHLTSNREPAALEQALSTLPSVEAVFSLERARREVHRNFAGSTRVLTITLLLSIVVAIVFLGVLAALDAADHAGDLALLRALGWRDRALFGLCLTEVGTRGLIALLGALPVAPLLARWIVSRISQANHYHMEVHHPGWLYGLVVAAVLLLLPLGAVPAWRAARRITPARALRLLSAQ